MPVKKYYKGETWYLDGQFYKTIKQKDLDKMLDIIDDYIDLVECIDER